MDFDLNILSKMKTDLIKVTCNSNTLFYNRAFLIGPKGIYVHFTDSVVRHLKSETVFQFSLRSSASLSNQNSSENQNSRSDSQQNLSSGSSRINSGFDVVFEQVTSLLDHHATNNQHSPTPNSNSN